MRLSDATVSAMEGFTLRSIALDYTVADGVVGAVAGHSRGGGGSSRGIMSGLKLKISVLASGAILLDSQRADLEQLEAALEWVKQNRGQVWYYREPAGA